MNIERKIKMRWTERNVNRINKWLKLENDWKGWFSQNGKRRGYKLVDGTNKYMTFVFCK